MIVKLDGSGNTEWIKVIGDTGQDHFSKVLKLDSGGYIVCGRTTSGEGFFFQILLAKITENGELEWSL